MEVPDIVERVLLLLDLQDVFRASRVCRLWKNTIDKSNALQQHLFFRPDFTSLHICLNPLIRIAFRTFQRRYIPEEAWYIHGACKDIFDLAPFPWQGGRRMADRIAKKGQSILRQDASWRRMLVFQPPVVELDMIRWVGQYGGTGSKRGGTLFRNGDGSAMGLRMGALYGIVLDQYHHLGFPFKIIAYAWHRARPVYGVNEEPWFDPTAPGQGMPEGRVWKARDWSTYLRLMVRVDDPFELQADEQQEQMRVHMVHRAHDEAIAKPPELKMREWRKVEDALRVEFHRGARRLVKPALPPGGPFARRELQGEYLEAD